MKRKNHICVHQGAALAPILMSICKRELIIILFHAVIQYLAENAIVKIANLIR